jgi:hypothetical protein
MNSESSIYRVLAAFYGKIQKIGWLMGYLAFFYFNTFLGHQGFNT